MFCVNIIIIVIDIIVANRTKSTIICVALVVSMMILCWQLRSGYGKLFVLAITFICYALNASICIVSADNPTVVLQQPCDRSRRVFTDARGEISNGPIGSNYTQVNVPVGTFLKPNTY